MSKLMGAIPPGFAVRDGILVIGGQKVTDLVDAAGGTPLFVYDLDMIAARVKRFRAAFPGISLHYAVKANPNAEVLRFLSRHVDGFDIASEGELQLATSAGMLSERISFAGPGKRDEELRAAIARGITLNLESEAEADRALRIAGDMGVPPRLAVRVNPDFEIRGSGMRMGGGAKPFGVDAERVPALVRHIIDAGADWRGFHIFAGSQALSADALIEAQKETLALALRLSEAAKASPPHINLGGGFGVPYFHGEQPLDIKRVGHELILFLNKQRQVFKKTELIIELGRWLVAEAGVYLTRIIDRKTSHGKLFLVTDGGMHHQLAASGNFGQIVRRNFPLAVATKFDQPDEEEGTIVGCLCTPLDRLGDDLLLPRAEPGDLIAIFLAGAYGLSASPQAFLGQRQALEMTVGNPR